MLAGGSAAWARRPGMLRNSQISMRVPSASRSPSDGHAHRPVEAAEMRVDRRAVGAQDHELAGLVRRDDERAVELVARDRGSSSCGRCRGLPARLPASRVPWRTHRVLAHRPRARRAAALRLACRKACSWLGDSANQMTPATSLAQAWDLVQPLRLRRAMPDTLCEKTPPAEARRGSEAAERIGQSNPLRKMTSSRSNSNAPMSVWPPIILGNPEPR